MTSKKQPKRSEGNDGGDELIDQWSFLDSMIERQASSLRAGAQDPEEDDDAVVVLGTGGAEVEELRRVLAAIELERDTLRKDLTKARKDLKATDTQQGATTAAAELATAHAELETVRADLVLATKSIEHLAGLETMLEEERRLVADLRLQLASAPAGDVVEQLREDVARERRLRERADANSSDLMRALREAHTEVEAAEAAKITAQVALAEAAIPPPQFAVRSPAKAPQTPAAQLAERPGFAVFEPPKEAPMPTRYGDGPPATSSTDLVPPADDNTPKHNSFKDRLFGRRR